MIENFSKGILGEEAYPSPACARKRVCKAKEEEDLKIDACYNVLALIILTLGTKRHLCIHILSEACFATPFQPSSSPVAQETLSQDATPNLPLPTFHNFSDPVMYGYRGMPSGV